MAKRDRIGKVSVGVTPEFDQAALFREVKAAAAKVPALKLPVKITAKDVNAAIREVNEKSLTKLKLDVSISKQAVNAAIRERNASPGSAKLQVDVKFSPTQVRRALKEAKIEGLMASSILAGKPAILKAERDIAQARKNLWTETNKHALRNQADLTKAVRQSQTELGNQWKQASRHARDFQNQLTKAANAPSFLQKTNADLRHMSVNLRGLEFAIRRMLHTTALAFAAWGAGITLAVGAAVGASVVSFARLETSARNAAAIFAELEPGFNNITKASERMAAVSKITSKAMDSARRASLQTTFTAKDTADGLFFLASAGVRAQDAMKELGDISKFAQAGMFDIQRGSELLLQAVNATGEGMSNLGKVADLLTEANLRSQTTLEDLSVALTNKAGAAFRLFRRPVVETIGLLQELGNVGQVGADAGTNLAIIIREIGRSAAGASPKGEGAVQMFKQLGIHALDAQGNLGSIADILDKLAAKFENFSVRKQILTLKELGFTDKASQGIRRLLVRSQALQKHNDSLQKEVDKLGRTAKGSTARIAEEQLNTLGARFQIFKNNVAALAQVFAGPVAGALTKFFEKIGKDGALFDRFSAAAERLGTQVAGKLVIFLSSIKLSDIKDFFFKLYLAVKLTLQGVQEFFTEFAKGLGKTGDSASILDSIGQAALIMGRGFAAIAPVVGEVLGKFVRFVEEHPAMTKVIIAATLALFAFTSAIRLVILPMTELALAFEAITGIEVAAALGGITAAGLILVAELAGLVIWAYAMGKAFEKLYNSSHIAARGMDFFSGAVLAVQPAVRKTIELVSDLILKMEGLPTGDFKGIDTSKAKRNQDRARAFRAGLPQGPPIPGSAKQGPPVPKAIQDQWDAQKDIQGQLAQMKGAWDDQVKSLDKTTGGTNSYTKALRAANGQAKAASDIHLDHLQKALDSLEGPLERQKTLVDALKDALESLKNVQFKGTKAFEDQKFALDQQTKALQLQQVQLKLGGALDGDPRIKALQDQIDSLGLQAQQVDLSESLKLDPLKKQWDETVNPIVEVDFSAALKQFKFLQMAHTAETEKLAKLQSGYDAIKASMEGTRHAAQRLHHTFNAQIAGIPATAHDGGATAGVALMSGLETGISSQLTPGSPLHTVLNKDIADFIRANKGPIAYDQTILVPAGVAIMEGLTSGLQRGFEPVKGFLRAVGPQMEEYVPDNMFGKRTAEFLVQVAAGKKPNPATFFSDLVPTLPDIQFGATGGNPFKVVEGMFNLNRSSGDSEARGVHATNSYHYRPAPWGGVQAYDYGDAINSSKTLQALVRFAHAHADMFAEEFYDKASSYIKNGKIIPGIFGGHGDHVHLAFRKAFSVGGASTPYDGFFAAAAAAFGIPAPLLKAVAKAESGFKANASSGAGAKGIMQLLPATFAAQHVGSNIFDPGQNIIAGAKYLAAQLHHFHSIKLALAAYNAGPGNAQLALHSFSETIAYVARIMRFLKDFGGFRALGGPTSGGKAYIVGERGPELWMERRPGHILNNKDLTEMTDILREIRDTGGLRQQTTQHIQTASQDPAVVAKLLEIKSRRRAARIRR